MKRKREYKFAPKRRGEGTLERPWTSRNLKGDVEPVTLDGTFSDSIRLRDVTNPDGLRSY